MVVLPHFYDPSMHTWSDVQLVARVKSDFPITFTDQLEARDILDSLKRSSFSSYTAFRVKFKDRDQPSDNSVSPSNIAIKCHQCIFTMVAARQSIYSLSFSQTIDIFKILAHNNRYIHYSLSSSQTIDIFIIFELNNRYVHYRRHPTIDISTMVGAKLSIYSLSLC